MGMTSSLFCMFSPPRACTLLGTRVEGGELVIAAFRIAVAVSDDDHVDVAARAVSTSLAQASLGSVREPMTPRARLRAARASVALVTAQLLAGRAGAQSPPTPALPSLVQGGPARTRQPLMPSPVPSLTLEPVSFAPPPQPPAAAPHRFSRGEAVGLGLVSSVLGLGSVVVDYLPAPPLAGLKAKTYYHYGTETLAAVPIAVASPVDALEVGDWTAAIAEGNLALRYDGARGSASSLNPFWEATESLGLHQGFYAGYVAYRDARVAGTSSVWDDAWRPYTADELLVSPLHWSNINHPVVWAGVSADVGITGVVVGVELGAKIAPPASPGAVARNIALGTLTSWDSGITEDPLFRGFFYEELQLSLGRWPARAIDMSLFTLAHVPGEIGQSPIVILAEVADRAAAGLLFEIAYDEGGLLESAAFHVLFDIADNLVTSFIGTSPATPHPGFVHAFGEPSAPATIGLGGPLAQPVHQVFSLSLPL